MTVIRMDDPTNKNRPRTAFRSKLNGMTTSVGRFYEKRHQLHDAFDQYSKALSSDPDDTATYIDRSRVLLKMGSIHKAQKDTDTALTLISDKKLSLVNQRNPALLSYYACLQKAEVLYADGEFELALMYFHRANKVKPAQQTCFDGIRKATEILECTICSPNARLTISGDLINFKEEQTVKPSLRNRSPIRRQPSLAEVPLTEYSDQEANRLLIEVAKDRKLLMDLYNDKQPSAGFTGLEKAKNEARQAISITEAQLKFLDKAECLHTDEQDVRPYLTCSSNINRAALVRIAEEELIYLQKLPSKEKSMEIIYRSMKVIHCLRPSDHPESSLDFRARLMLAEAFRLVGRSYTEIKIFDQALENYWQAHQTLLPIKDQGCLYRATYDIARCFIAAKKYDQASQVLIDMLSKATSNNERTFAYQNLSLCYLDMNDLDRAKKYAIEALDHASTSNDDELLLIEANILLGKIYLISKDFPRAEEYIIYAQKLKDQLGDLDGMQMLDDLLVDIKHRKEDIFKQKLSPFVPSEEPYFNSQIEEQWLSSVMQRAVFKQIDVRNSVKKSARYWRILTPYHRLFDMCVDRKRKIRRNIQSQSPSQPFISAANSLHNSLS